MKVYFQLIKAIINKYILKKNTGETIRIFCENLGIVYIKIAQIIATQNHGKLFSEEDRKSLSSICDNCNPIDFKEIKNIIEEEYKCKYPSKVSDIFASIDPTPIGSASISQVHKGILKDGTRVAIKIKRLDITKTIEKDINRIKRRVRRYKNIVKFENILGSDKALGMYLNWIYQEIDFKREIQNIKQFKTFADSVNGKVTDTKDIKVPEVFQEFCTENIIVMEYIEHKTINQMELNEVNKNRIATAMNSYLKLCFYALFNNKPIILHGDPHGANIYIDEEGNIGFLDMGLIFKISEDDAKLLQDFFIYAFTNNYEKVYESFISNSHFKIIDKEKFKQGIKEVCEKLKKMSVTSYLPEMIPVFYKCNILPPDFLFALAKHFICLDGISVFSKNKTKANELLFSQIIELYISNSINDSCEIAVKSISVLPKVMKNIFRSGLLKGLAETTPDIQELYFEAEKNLNNVKVMLEILKNANAKNGAQENN